MSATRFASLRPLRHRNFALVWFGGMVLALGGLIVMWPGGSPAVKRAQAGYAVRLVGEK